MPELADIIGQGKTSVHNHIAYLRKLGILSRLGSEKAGDGWFSLFLLLRPELGGKWVESC